MTKHGILTGLGVVAVAVLLAGPGALIGLGVAAAMVGLMALCAAWQCLP